VRSPQLCLSAHQDFGYYYYHGFLNGEANQWHPELTTGDNQSPFPFTGVIHHIDFDILPDK
jgi:hypothetical protein